MKNLNKNNRMYLYKFIKIDKPYQIDYFLSHSNIDSIGAIMVRYAPLGCGGSGVGSTWRRVNPKTVKLLFDASLGTLCIYSESKISWLVIRIMCPSEATCRCFSQLSTTKMQQVQS